MFNKKNATAKNELNYGKRAKTAYKLKEIIYKWPTNLTVINILFMYERIM